ncbi:MAG: undecaprenyl-phosphate glucose phosphotransferase [Pseudomonadota bacterium]
MLTDNTRQLTRQPQSAKAWVQRVLDHVVVQGLLYLHASMHSVELVNDYRIQVVMTLLLMSTLYNWADVYRHEAARADYISNLLQGWGMVVMAMALFTFVIQTTEDFLREVILVWSISAFLGQLMVYFFIRTFMFKTIKESVPSLIVGSGELGQHIAAHLRDNPWIPDQVVGVIEHSPGDESSDPPDVPVLGTLDNLDDVIREHRIRRVYLTLAMTDSQQIQSLSIELVNRNIDVIWAPDIFNMNLLNYSIKELAGVPLIGLSETPLVGGRALAKNLMDIVLASLAIIALAPLLIVTALAVKLTSKGPVFFMQKRHGWDGEIFEVYKFRSMIVHEETEGHLTQARRDDDRITAIGRFIRRTSIDELPQLLNVLQGDMSLVGPRTHAVAHNEVYSEQIKSYMLRHRIKPGLTGLAQVNGFRGETETLDKMEGRVNFDLAYINNWNLALDVEIMIRTIFVLFSKNAY